jgi:hypothetical protein
MKTQLRKLHLLFLLTKLNPEMFYSISCMEDGIMLQGNYNTKLIAGLKRIGYDFKYSDSGFSELIINNITITLT